MKTISSNKKGENTTSNYQSGENSSWVVSFDDFADYENFEYVSVSTSGDENVCPMCAQVEGKIFPKNRAPKPPLCPSCACALKYYRKHDLPPNAVISNLDDFVLPSTHVKSFHNHNLQMYKEKNIMEQIKICRLDLIYLPDFMKPYLSAGFPAPTELACRDLLPDLYMWIGKWSEAEAAIQRCINSGAYFPNNGTKEMSRFKLFKEIAAEALSYIDENPGILQRSIYKNLGYSGEKREALKDFLRCSKQIEKVKSGNTNQLYSKNFNT